MHQDFYIAAVCLLLGFGLGMAFAAWRARRAAAATPADGPGPVVPKDGPGPVVPK